MQALGSDRCVFICSQSEPRQPGMRAAMTYSAHAPPYACQLCVCQAGWDLLALLDRDENWGAGKVRVSHQQPPAQGGGRICVCGLPDGEEVAQALALRAGHARTEHERPRSAARLRGRHSPIGLAAVPIIGHFPDTRWGQTQQATGLCSPCPLRAAADAPSSRHPR